VIGKSSTLVHNVPNMQLMPRKNQLGGTARSLSVVPNGKGGISRKAIREGIDMLEAKFLQKDSSMKANALESRIKRLVYEEQRAKKLTDIASEKAEKLLKARERHQRELEEKVYRQHLKMSEIQKQVEKNKIIKELHAEKVKNSKY